MKGKWGIGGRIRLILRALNRVGGGVGRVDCYQLIYRMLGLVRNFNKFGSLNAQAVANKSKNAVRFESQNVLWDHEEVNYQSVALAKGLTSLALGKSTPRPTQTIPSSSASRPPSRPRPTSPNSPQPPSPPTSSFPAQPLPRRPKPKSRATT